MYVIEVCNFPEWRAAARPLLAARVSPAEVLWGDSRSPCLLSDSATVPAAEPQPESPVALSRELIKLLEEIAHYRDSGRWELMYRLAWRALSNRALLEDHADPDVSLALQMAKAIHRDVHKMHAFVRFRETTGEDGAKRYVTWFEPAHEILKLGAPFFVRRFPNMKWIIATPDGAAVWDGNEIRYIDAPDRSTLPQGDAHETLWRAYYRNICNVARIDATDMQREMPQRYWRHLPDAGEVPVLLHEGGACLQGEAKECQAPLPRAMAEALAKIAQPTDTAITCRRCDLWKHATQAVLGEGAEQAAIMVVGEQPGDEEDLRGRPFVGPAGRLLDHVLKAAGLRRDGLYITNAVKHFKWEPRGRRRLHKRPEVHEIAACGVWLEQEIQRVSPRVIIALGTIAQRSLLGTTQPIELARREMFRHGNGAGLIVTYHPSAILRADGDRAAQLRAALIEDLQRARDAADSSSAPQGAAARNLNAGLNM